MDLAQRRLDIAGVRLGHRLPGDRRGAADDNAADVHRDRLAAGGHPPWRPGNCPGAVRWMSRKGITPAIASRAARPTCCRLSSAVPANGRPPTTPAPAPPPPPPP